MAVVTDSIWSMVRVFMDIAVFGSECGMKTYIKACRFAKQNRFAIQTICIACVCCLLTWLLFKQIALRLVRLANSPRIGKSGELLGARTYDEALQVSFHKASWELVRDNVGVYAIQGRRASMEDRFNVVTNIKQGKTALYGLFDGHGGEFSAEYAEKTVFKRLLTRLVNDSVTFDAETVSALLKDEIVAVDRQLLSILRSAYDQSGTTALVALHLEGHLYVANVGDSRAVMCNHNKEAIPLSYDHKPDSPSEKERIENAGGFVMFFGVWRVNGILATSRALGDAELKRNDIVSAQPDVRAFNLAEHRPLFIILASDGLWDVFSNDDAVAYISEHLGELDFGAKSLVAEAYSRGSTDNISVIVVNLREVPRQVASTG